jgi:hypothetical protein
VAATQAEFSLPPARECADESEQEAEARWHAVLLRKMEEAADEVGRARICYALHVAEGTLSKKLRGIDDKVADARLLAYLVKHQKSARLARWLMADYAGYLPPQRPDRLKLDEFAREMASMALSGELGREPAQKVLALYERTERKP